jgi:hypothetical protein
MVCPHLAVGENSLQIWMVAACIFNRQSQTLSKRILSDFKFYKPEGHRFDS